jgi:hypothetical protein
MKKVLLYIPVVLSLVVLGAHFMRYGNWIGVFGSLLVIALLFVRRPWAARAIQVVLLLGALEWAHTLYELVQIRAAHGQPFMRMAVIIGVVQTVTLLSALLFQVPDFKRIYGLNGRGGAMGKRSGRCTTAIRTGVSG